MNLPTQFQQFIYLSRYSRYQWDKNRRENWPETVKRYFDFFEEHLSENFDYTVPPADRKELEEAVLKLEVMPSMRALMTAGKALKKDHIAGYNCSYVAVDHANAFNEIMFILMNGTGVGFSVERQHIQKLPVIPEELHPTDTAIIVADSKLGWAKGLKQLIALLYNGEIPKWDLHKIRPAGEPLKTFGGRASGPGPLDELFRFVVNVFKEAAGRKLTSIECHDLVCKIAEIVVVGGVRRSALISLSNLSDDRMRLAKSGEWWTYNVQRALANNSAVYTEKPEMMIFLKEWMSLIESQSGERGIFNRDAANRQAAKNGRREAYDSFGTNPCGEIILRNKGFCNLTEVVARADDTEKELARKVRLATILGTWQSTLTDFRYLGKEWKTNAEEERLLGVSITGIYDSPLLNNYQDEELPARLERLRLTAIQQNAHLAEKIGINPSAAITCVKPSGTVSQLVDASSGIHPRHSQYYIRTVRADKKDPLAQFMVQAGFPVEDDVTKPQHNYVFSFPVKAPESVYRSEISAIEHLKLWLIYKNHWCEHNPSVTINVHEDEWLEVGAWVYENFNEVLGVSFLPYSNHIYKQAPYQEVTAEEYEALLTKIPQNVDWSTLANFENKEDNTTGSQELACVSGSCDIL